MRALLFAIVLTAASGPALPMPVRGAESSAVPAPDSVTGAVGDTLRKIVPMPAVEVSTTRVGDRAPLARSVLGRADLRERNWGQDTPMVLATLPGAYAYSDAGNGIGYSYLTIRGFPQRRISVLIDGVPLNDPESHEVYWIDHPDLLASSAEAQVQRGVGSALYGAASVGGSVDLETAPFSELPQVSTSLTYGSFETKRLMVEGNSGRLEGGWNLYGRYSRIETFGYREQSWSKLWSYALSARRALGNQSFRINLFGGPLGLLHRHVTGAIPIRRNTKDPAYLITLKAYVAELLKKHDLFFYPEGGRSYSGELKAVKTGLIHAALTAERPDLVIVPVAIAYDLVLEDHVLARQRVKKRQRAFARELAEMVRYAVGYRSRAFVTFGSPIPVAECDPQSRSDVMALTRLIRARIGALHKVLPTAVFAAAMRPSITRRDLESRIDRLIEELGARHANLGVASGKQAIDEAAESLETRGIVVLERGRFRVRERSVLRYYGRTIEHLLVTTGRTH